MMCLPKYERSTTPPAMRFQERDGQILKAIRDYDGVLAKHHLKEMFWPDATWRAMEMRLSLLYHQGYLNWPSALQLRTRPIPEPICWLGWKGALYLASEAGLETSAIANPTETKLRQLSRDLRKQGLRWQREPRWNQLQHDIAIIDFRLAVEKSVREVPQLEIEQWVPEGDFLTKTDEVEYRVEIKSGLSKSAKRGVRPDGYFALIDKQRLKQGLPARARFLVEVDMATHDLGSFVKEKAVAGWHYIHSPSYKARFGDNSGCWLIIMSSDVRQKHLMKYVNEYLGSNAKLFMFTTLNEVNQCNLLSCPIWRQAGQAKPLALLNI